jgi:hypothetical protein
MNAEKSVKLAKTLIFCFLTAKFSVSLAIGVAYILPIGGIEYIKRIHEHVTTEALPWSLQKA